MHAWQSRDRAAMHMWLSHAELALIYPYRFLPAVKRLQLINECFVGSTECRFVCCFHSRETQGETSFIRNRHNTLVAAFLSPSRHIQERNVLDESIYGYVFKYNVS